MQQNISLIEYDINSFFDNTKYMLRMLSNHTAVRNVDASLNEYISKTGISNIDTIEKSATEAAVFNLFKNIKEEIENDKSIDVCFYGNKVGRLHVNV